MVTLVNFSVQSKVNKSPCKAFSEVRKFNYFFML